MKMAGGVTKEIHELKTLGGKIKALRQSRGFRLRDVSEKAGCTSAYVSQIEKGIVSPSISTLKNIANTLGVKLVDLFITDGDPSDEVTLKSGEGCEIKYPRDNASITLLVRNLTGKNMEPLLKRLAPGIGSDGLYSHSGSQEFGYVLSGEFDLLIEDKTYTLKKGDSFYFNSSRPHGFVNNGKKVAEILWVIDPPTY